jgi:hypothetical protein
VHRCVDPSGSVRASLSSDLDIAYCLRLTAPVHRCYPPLSTVDHYSLLLFEGPCCCACHMAFCKLAHDLLDPCRKARMLCKTADPTGVRQLAHTGPRATKSVGADLDRRFPARNSTKALSFGDSYRLAGHIARTTSTRSTCVSRTRTRVPCVI